jgi:zinc transporter 1
MLEHGHSHGDHDHLDPPSQHNKADLPVNTQSQERRTSITDSQTIPRARSDSTSSTFGHPAALRASFNQAAEEMRRARSPSPTSRNSTYRTSQISIDRIQEESRGRISLSGATNGGWSRHITHERTPLLADEPVTSPAPVSHNHAPSGHSHSHGSMNMKAILLHVMGDALGNVGVIATGLIIWFTHWSFKYYFDPIISLVITVIIFSSALPLGKD